MFLCNIDTYKLDKLMKSFEVAYRSHISYIIIDKFKTVEDFNNILNKININNSSLVNSGKFNSKLNNIKKNHINIYNSIRLSYESIKKKDVVFNNDNLILYVSQLIDLVFLLATPYFNNLYTNFDTQEKFIYYSNVYKNIRNILSHPASSKISIEDTKIIIFYIKTLINIIDDKCFWYDSKINIKTYIDELTKTITNIPININNLNEIAIQYQNVIGRENEIDELSKWIIGEEGSYRTANSVVAYGYGGIGKTTLIVDFIYYLLNKIKDKEIDNKYNYILFFSSKDEKLSYKETSDKLYIDKIRQQITSFEDFKNSICNYLSIENKDDKNIYEYMDKNNGIIIIDNIENLINKNDLIRFIKRSPRSVQYIVTSRNEEMCEEKLNVIGFDERNNGLKFIDRYIETNQLNINLTEKDKKNLIVASRGNTLILVTSLERIKSKKSNITDIISELTNISSYNTQQIAEFMYKNTLDQTLEELKEYNVEKLLNIIVLYDEPINLYAMSELTGMLIQDIEIVCETLTSKLVLYKAQDLFRLNDFASKFILSKVLNNELDLKNLSKKIEDFKQQINLNLSQLEKRKQSDKFLFEVMNDWIPRNNIDKIIIANVFNYYSSVSNNLKKIKKQKNIKEDILKEIENIEEEFKKYELKSPHPYIRYQKARVYKLFIENNICNKNSKEFKLILDRMKTNFEESKFSTEFYYKHIEETLSYAAFLWIYGTFLRIYIKDNENALNILSQSKNVYEKLNKKDINYIKLCNELAKCYKSKYYDNKNKNYYDECKELCTIILDLENKIPECDKFDFNRFRKNFKNFIQK